MFKQSTKEKSKFLPTDRKHKNKVLISGTLIAIGILITPYLFTLYGLFPDTPVWESPFGIYESKYFESVNVLAWSLMGKVLPLYLLMIWFFTCRHWWYHVILVPICLYTYQTYNIINDDILFADVSDIYVLAPIVLVMAIFSYTIRTKIFDKIHGIDLSELSRVSLKGDLKKEDHNDNEDDDDDDDDDEEGVFMG